MKENCIDCILRTDTDITPEQLFFMTRYVPYRVVKMMGESACCFFERTIEKFQGVMVYLDIIGFTKIVDGYMKTGRDVADLTNTLSDYYSVVIETVRGFGGSVFQFAGDSILICFERLKDESDENNLRRALAAMMLIIDLSNNYNTVSEEFVNFTLKPKIGMGQGEIFQIFLGDTEYSMTPVLTGAAVIQAIKMEEACTTQEIVVSIPVWNLACKMGLERCFAEQEGFYHLTDIPEDFASSVERPEYIDVETWFTNPRFYNRLYSFINPIIFSQIKNNVQGFDGEYRNVTCCMVRFDGVFQQAVSEASIAEGYASLNKIYKDLQDIASRFSGYCGKPDLSDKGIVFPVFFGMPVAIEYKERMAMLFANKLIEEEQKEGGKIIVNVGIATGVVYAGEFGANMRKDFTIVGNAINFAARLMMNATNHGAFTVFIDEATKSKTAAISETETMPGIMLKGFSEMQTVYHLLIIKKDTGKVNHKTELLGRSGELAALASLYEKSRRGELCFAPIIGDIGIGKSYLVEQCTSDIMAKYADTVVMYGRAYSYESGTPFFLWRDIIKRVVGITDSMQGEMLLLHVLNKFARDLPSDKNWVSYFLTTLGYSFAENPVTARLDAATKQQHFFSLVYTLLVNYAENHPLVIVLENLQWSDNLSLHLLSYLFRKPKTAPILIIPVSRESKTIKRLYSLNNMKVLRLAHLRDATAAQLAAKLLDFETPDKLLIAKIVAVAGGNPMYIEVIVESLISGKKIDKTEDGHYHLVGPVNDIKIPYTIENVILVQLNALPYEAQVICKNASVIGRTFSLDVLEALVGETISHSVVEHSLAELEAHGFILCNNAKRTLFTFKDATMRDVIYKTIIESTRKSLNTAIMNYLEEKYKDNIRPAVGKLLYYAEEAKDDDAIAKYTKLAAEN
ncbi:AAA family ATPase [Treponema socranskii]|uniref:AAA family ATPase n=1 Tax=Treponema socranskii TaxID=53419 RepID=UPI003D940A6D